MAAPRKNIPPNQCPFCRKVYDKPFVVCTHCGMNRKTGQLYDQTIIEDDGEQPPSRWLVAAAWFAEYFPGLFRPFTLIGTIIITLIGLAILALGLALAIGFMAIPSGMMIVAVGALFYAQAIAWVLLGEMGFLLDQLVEFDEMRWMLFFVGLLTPGTMLIVISNYVCGG